MRGEQYDSKTHYDMSAGVVKLDLYALHETVAVAARTTGEELRDLLRDIQDDLSNAWVDTYKLHASDERTDAQRQQDAYHFAVHASSKAGRVLALARQHVLAVEAAFHVQEAIRRGEITEITVRGPE